MNYELFEFSQEGYKSLMTYQNWRVAILNYIDDCSLDGLIYFEAHHETDEVFVLLDGSATLLFLDVNNEKSLSIEAVHLEKNKIYNVKKDVYHTQVLSIDAKLLIIEEDNTGDLNSTKYYIDSKLRTKIKEIL